MATAERRVWDCPVCHRHVPIALDTCRCGTPRSQAVVSGARASIQSAEDAAFPRTLVVAVVVLVVAFALLIWRATHRPPEPPMVPLLGSTTEAEQAAQKAAAKERKPPERR